MTYTWITSARVDRGDIDDEDPRAHPAMTVASLQPFDPITSMGADG